MPPTTRARNKDTHPGHILLASTPRRKGQNGKTVKQMDEDAKKNEEAGERKSNTTS